MNSSGIKRGLAAGAISALAVTGLPFLASSASAATGDSITVASVGPVRNAGAEGGVVVLKTKNVDPTKLALIGSDLVSSPNTPSESAAIVGTPSIVLDGATGDSNKTDGLDEITLRLAVTTANAGDVKNLAVYEDEGNAGKVDASEARAQLSVTTAGAVASIDVTSEQTAPQGFDSGKYNVTLRDAGNRVTQLTGAEKVTLTPSGVAQVSESTNEIVASEAPEGTRTFTAKAADNGDYNIDLAGPTTGVKATAKLHVTKVATGLTAGQIDVATGADTWDDNGAFDTPFEVRNDQKSITVSIDGGDAVKNTVVALDATGANGITFDKAATKSVLVSLDNAGKGSVTFTPDAGTVTNAGSISITSPSFSFAGDSSTGPVNKAIELTFAKASFDSLSSNAKTLISKFGGTVSTTVTAVDQFGNPVKGLWLSANRTGGGANGTSDAMSPKQATNDQGQATFSFTDAKATTASHANDAITVYRYADQYDATSTASGDVATIVYTADGLGNDFGLTVDGKNIADTDYKVTDAYATFAPLTSAVEANGSAPDGNAGDDAVIHVANGTQDVPVTVSVDNGALLLPTGKHNFADGKQSIDTALSGTGTGDFTVIGTKAGLVNVTVASGGRTKTAQVMVKPTGDATTARNVEISGPEKAKNNDVVTFTAHVTDAFGNPVQGAWLNDTLTGPASFQSGGGASDANGVVTYVVELSDTASSPVAMQVKGIADMGSGVFNQFGASANYVTDADDNGTPVANPNASGFTASQSSAKATIANVANIDKLQAAVDAAQDKVDAAQDKLTADQGTLAVAKAERAAAVKAVKRAKLAVEQAETRRELRAAKARLAEAKDRLAVAQAAVDAAKAVVAIDLTRLAKAEAVLAAAQQALADAQA